MAEKQLQNITPLSLESTNDLSAAASQYTFVIVDPNNDNSVIPSGLDGKAIGILDNKPAAGQQAAVVTSGIQKVVTGAAVTRGSRGVSDANGAAINFAYGTHRCPRGWFLEAATAAGQIVNFLIDKTYDQLTES